MGGRDLGSFPRSLRVDGGARCRDSGCPLSRRRPALCSSADCRWMGGFTGYAAAKSQAVRRYAGGDDRGLHCSSRLDRDGDSRSDECLGAARGGSERVQSTTWGVVEEISGGGIPSGTFKLSAG